MNVTLLHAKHLQSDFFRSKIIINFRNQVNNALSFRIRGTKVVLFFQVNV